MRQANAAASDENNWKVHAQAAGGVCAAQPKTVSDLLRLLLQRAQMQSGTAPATGRDAHAAAGAVAAQDWRVHPVAHATHHDAAGETDGMLDAAMQTAAEAAVPGSALSPAALPRDDQNAAQATAEADEGSGRQQQAEGDTAGWPWAPGTLLAIDHGAWAQLTAQQEGAAPAAQEGAAKQAAPGAAAAQAAHEAAAAQAPGAMETAGEHAPGAQQRESVDTAAGADYGGAQQARAVSYEGC